MELPTVTPELRELYRRGIEDPTNLTRSERNQIFHLLPPEEEDHIIQTKLKLGSKEELIAKAYSAPDTLTKDEAGFLTVRRPKLRTHMSDEDQKLGDEAYQSVITKEEHQAWINAIVRKHAIAKQEADERAAKSKRHLEAYKLAAQQPRAAWVQKMVDADVQQWGFVCFRVAYTGRADDPAWDRFKEYYTATGKYVSSLWRGLSELWPKHNTIFVSDNTLDGASSEALRKRFSEMRANNEIPDGVRTDVFLVADERTLLDEAILSGKPYNVSPATLNFFMRHPVNYVKVPAPFLKAVDPTHDPSAPVPTNGPYAGFNGEFEYPLPKTFDWLNYSFWAGTETMKQRYWQTQAFEWMVDWPPFAPYPLYSCKDPKR